jgi:hypothetical protein
MAKRKQRRGSEDNIPTEHLHLSFPVPNSDVHTVQSVVPKEQSELTDTYNMQSISNEQLLDNYMYQFYWSMTHLKDTITSGGEEARSGVASKSIYSQHSGS